VADVEVEHGLALIMIVGEGMRYTVGVASRAVTALAEAGVNIEMMNQGSSEISMMFGVKELDRRRAVRALYHAFFTAEAQEDTEA
jgi:aspartate kinase